MGERTAGVWDVVMLSGFYQPGFAAQLEWLAAACQRWPQCAPRTLSVCAMPDDCNAALNNALLTVLEQRGGSLEEIRFEYVWYSEPAASNEDGAGGANDTHYAPQLRLAANADFANLVSIRRCARHAVCSAAALWAACTL